MLPLCVQGIEPSSSLNLENKTGQILNTHIITVTVYFRVDISKGKILTINM